MQGIRSLLVLVAVGAASLLGQAAHAQLSVVAGTFNIGAGRHGGHSGYNLQWVINDINGLLSYVDVLALQEVNRKQSPQTNCDDQFAKIVAQTSWAFPAANARFAPFPAPPNLWCSWTAPADLGPALLSKHPVVRSWTVTLPYGRTAVGAEIWFPTGAAVVYSVHLSHQYASHRNAQAIAIANDIYARSNGLPVMVLGDFNALPGDPELQALRGIMWSPIQSQNLTTQGYVTIPFVDDPNTTDVREGMIDFAFASPWWSATHLQIGHSWSSDHFPMVFYYYR